MFCLASGFSRKRKFSVFFFLTNISVKVLYYMYAKHICLFVFQFYTLTYIEQVIYTFSKDFVGENYLTHITSLFVYNLGNYLLHNFQSPCCIKFSSICKTTLSHDTIFKIQRNFLKKKKKIKRDEINCCRYNILWSLIV